MEHKLKINGEEHSYEADAMPANISQLLQQLEIDAATVVAEIDGQIVERKNFAETSLQPGQQIELIRFVGGG
ncbi:sulfur carrier protein ThiS [Anaerohalosphaera lusitana]|nr:sulfur carrier protein ThiS [Anaerohalosphaera lusitana]